MRIVYVYDGSWPRGATRVRKETAALAEGGHEVLLLARNQENAPAVEHEDWMEVRRLPTVPGRMNALFGFPFFFNPVWVAHIYRQASQWGADAIMVEDLPLAPTAIWIGEWLNIPVVYDMGEVYPEFLRGMWEFGEPTMIDWVIRNPAFADLLERYALNRADHVIVVSEESRDRAMERGGDHDRITIVGNTPEGHAELSRPRARPEELESAAGRPIVLFTGILIFDRGILDAVRAMAEVRSSIPDALFVIVGDGPARPEIELEVERLELHHNVWLLGWKQHESLPGYYQHASVGLLPFMNGGQIRYTLANKLFDYMGAGLPVIASDVPPMRRVVTETGAGSLVPAADPRALAEAIATILGMSDEERATLGARGRDAVGSRYNWSVDSERLRTAVAATLAPSTGHRELRQTGASKGA